MSPIAATPDSDTRPTVELIAAENNKPKVDESAFRLEDFALAAIAAQLAPYQPTDTAFPLVYHGQIAADGTILALESVSEQDPTIEIPENTKISPPPERLIQIEITYTGAERPIVRER